MAESEYLRVLPPRTKGQVPTVIRGLTWDHPRGYDCLADNVAAFHRLNPDIEIIWHRRSLHQFGAQPIEVLARDYDLLLIDHPFVGRAAAQGLLIDMTDVIGRDAAEMISRASIGPNKACYHWQGGIYALPTDAAVQVGAYRPDLLERLERPVPRRFDDVINLADCANANGMSIVTPACPTDAMCLTLTIAANLGRTIDNEAAFFGGLDDTLRCVEALVEASDRASVDWNPIQAFDAMSTGDTIAYVPFAFGYSNYARGSAGRRIQFTNIAGPGGDPTSGSLLGGAGCAVSSAATNLAEIARYLLFMHSDAHQRGAYFDAGGQPAARAAWHDPRLNAATNGFFADTIETMEKAYVRPRFDGFVAFFEDAGQIVNQRLRGLIDRRSACDAIARRYNSIPSTMTDQP